MGGMRGWIDSLKKGHETGNINNNTQCERKQNMLVINTRINSEREFWTEENTVRMLAFT